MLLFSVVVRVVVQVVVIVVLLDVAQVMIGITGVVALVPCEDNKKVVKYPFWKQHKHKNQIEYSIKIL